MEYIPGNSIKSKIQLKDKTGIEVNQEEYC